MATTIKAKASASHLSFVYPDYSFEERLADGLVHIVGVTLSIAAFILLLSQPAFDMRYLGVVQIYAACVIGLFCFSAAYHMVPRPELRPILRRFDQAAIYFKIAGTFTPMVFIVNTDFAYYLLTAIWLVATSGALIKLLAGERLDKHTIFIYLALGWSSILLLWPLFEVLAARSVWLVIIGGLLYTIGIYFNQSNTIKYSNAIWHSFVLAASTCHFVAIAGGVLM
ncbi:hemolysin III family protein [Ahrensia kielensis]|uniref:Hemolysin III family protein n=1 Tax=Ahrensia kielensis TaxID=76980 RepID=A0ABU9T341_9HYPH